MVSILFATVAFGLVCYLDIRPKWNTQPRHVFWACLLLTVFSYAALLFV